MTHKTDTQHWYSIHRKTYIITWQWWRHDVWCHTNIQISSWFLKVQHECKHEKSRPHAPTNSSDQPCYNTRVNFQVEKLPSWKTSWQSWKTSWHCFFLPQVELTTSVLLATAASTIWGCCYCYVIWDWYSLYFSDFIIYLPTQDFANCDGASLH